MNQKSNIVSVKLPSGFTFQFEKPTLLGLLSSGITPESIAENAFQKWLGDGIGFPSNDAPTVSKTALQKQRKEEVQRSKAIQQKIIDLSYQPKIIVGVADKSKGEISWSALSLADVSFIHKWFLTGGYNCAELELWASNHWAVIDVALNADKMHTAASQMLGITNEIVAYEVNKICTHRLLIWEHAKSKDKAKLDWYVQVMAQANKELEFNDEINIDSDQPQGEGIWLNGRWQKLSDIPEAP